MAIFFQNPHPHSDNRKSNSCCLYNGVLYWLIWSTFKPFSLPKITTNKNSPDQLVQCGEKHNLSLVFDQPKAKPDWCFWVNDSFVTIFPSWLEVGKVAILIYFMSGGPHNPFTRQMASERLVLTWNLGTFWSNFIAPPPAPIWEIRICFFLFLHLEPFFSRKVKFPGQNIH